MKHEKRILFCALWIAENRHIYLKICTFRVAPYIQKLGNSTECLWLLISCISNIIYPFVSNMLQSQDQAIKKTKRDHFLNSSKDMEALQPTSHVTEKKHSITFCQSQTHQIYQDPFWVKEPSHAAYCYYSTTHKQKSEIHCSSYNF